MRLKSKPKLKDQLDSSETLLRRQINLIDTAHARLTNMVCRCLSEGQFLAARGWTQRELKHARACCSVFSIDNEAQSWFPWFLSDPCLIDAGIEQICQILAPLPAGSKLQFFSTRKASLGGQTPLQCLKDKSYEQVARCAEGFVTR